MDHGRPRGSDYRLGAGPDHIDLGHEPPLSADGRSESIIDRRRISVQWFSGTILTGLCGAALMAGAVFASLDGETNFATVPERVGSALRGALGFGERLASVARKADKLPLPSEANFARQVIRVSTTSRVGRREVVRVRPFVRVAGNLSMTVSDLSANIPPFNPQRMLAESSPGATTDVADAAAADAEVSFVLRDLVPLLPDAKHLAKLSRDNIIAKVRDTANWTGNGAPRTAVAGLQPGFKLAYATEGDADPYAGFEARIVPENITLLPKTTSQTTGGSGSSERTIVVKKGESITSILTELGAKADEIRAIASMLGPHGLDGGLKEGQRLRILMSPTGASAKMHPVRVIVLGDGAVEAVVALSDLGKYVPVDVQNIDSEVTEAKQVEEEDDGSGVRLYQSIWETALRNKVPKPVIEQIVLLYSYDVDFQRKVQPGDSFEVLFADNEETPGSNKRNNVLFASLTVGGENKKYYRFQTPDDGVFDYYDETGKSTKKFLVRKPVVTGRMRSGFGMRRHPILGYSKMHTGVDWAAQRGTPIFAAGNGVVEKAGREGGYGKYVRLRHNNGYETAYGHMTAFAKGIVPGKRVRQGQVIGFVGSTGRSTGAHLHYEILINHRFVNPMRIKLPRGRALANRMLASFEKERRRVDNMMQLPAAPARVAQKGSTAGAGR